jgi:hypothetical protein
MDYIGRGLVLAKTWRLAEINDTTVPHPGILVNCAYDCSECTCLRQASRSTTLFRNLFSENTQRWQKYKLGHEQVLSECLQTAPISS